MTVAPKWRHKFRVYYEDTDSGGVVYYANYLKFAERARSEILRTAGMQPSTLAANRGVVFVVVGCACRYLRAARLDDLLIVETSCLACRGVRLKLAQKVFIATENDTSGEDASLAISAELETDLALVSLAPVSLAPVSIGATECYSKEPDRLLGKPTRLSDDIVRLFQPRS